MCTTNRGKWVVKGYSLTNSDPGSPLTLVLDPGSPLTLVLDPGSPLTLVLEASMRVCSVMSDSSQPHGL